MSIRETVPSKIDNRRRPRIASVPAVGRKVSVSPGLWATRDNDYRFTWLRGNTVVAVGPTYVPRAADFGRSLRVRVDTSNDAVYWLSGEATTRGRLVKRAVTLRLSGSSPAGGAAKVVARVGGLRNPGGYVTLKLGARKLARVKVVSGRATLRATGQRRGARLYKVVYSGSAKAAPTSKRVRIAVR